MIDYHRFCQIKHLHEQQGLNASQIANELALDPRTVAYWLAQEHFRPRKPTPRPSTLDPFKTEIVRMLERYPYSAAQVFQHLSDHGFDGGYSIVKAYVRTVRPRRQPAFLTLAFAPGECAQVDWGAFGSVPVGQTQRRLSFFVMVLCYSRMLYVEFTVSQTMEHFLACHQHAFEFFGGIPKKVMVDHLKSAVLKRALGEAPVLNAKYFDFATHSGFTIAPCNVGKGHEKGRVETGVGYVKKNFLAGLEIPDFSALNPAARHWLDTVANVRLHGETRDKPTTLWHIERPHLRPVPLHPFDIATVSQVRASRQFRMTLDTNRYSVPAHYAGQALTLKTYPDRLCVYRGDQLIARHARRYDRFQDIEDPDHPKPLLEQRKKARDHQLFRRFLALSPRAETYDLRLQVQNHFHLEFIKAKANLIFLGGVGLGKTHLATALGYAACLQGYSVLFASAIDVINTLAGAKNAGHLKAALKKYTKPALLILDELGYLPIDKAGADLLFQVISLRYEQGAIIITSNRAFKEWPKIFNNDSTLTAAILDRLLHHAETVIIEGKSFRMKDQLES